MEIRIDKLSEVPVRQQLVAIFASLRRSRLSKPVSNIGVVRLSGHAPRRRQTRRGVLQIEVLPLFSSRASGCGLISAAVIYIGANRRTELSWNPQDELEGAKRVPIIA